MNNTIKIKSKRQHQPDKNGMYQCRINADLYDEVCELAAETGYRKSKMLNLLIREALDRVEIV